MSEESNVIDLNAPVADRVWECVCGNQLFYIAQKGYIVCSECSSAHLIGISEATEPANDG